MAEPSSADSSHCSNTSDESEHQFYEAASNLCTLPVASCPGYSDEQDDGCSSDASEASFISSVSQLEHYQVGDSLNRGGPDGEETNNLQPEHWHGSGTTVQHNTINDVANCNVTADPVLYVEAGEANEAISRAAQSTAAAGYVSLETSLLSQDAKNSTDDVQNSNVCENVCSSSDDCASSDSSVREDNQSVNSEFRRSNIDPIVPLLADGSTRLLSEEGPLHPPSASPPDCSPVVPDDFSLAHETSEGDATSPPAAADPAQAADAAQSVEESARREELGTDCEPDREEEFDIYCLDSVTARDQEWELKVKDRDTDLTEDQMASATSSSLEEKREGNLLFTTGQHHEAIQRYNAGLQQCPLSAAQDRAMLYHNRAVAYSKMEHPKLALHSLSRALEHDPRYLKAVVRRAALHEQLDKLDEALQDYRTVLELDPQHGGARGAVQRLPPIIEEKNEKIKEEMMGKLKDLGNLFLRPFGLSTNNFQMEQDPTSGGYNIKFNQQPN